MSRASVLAQNDQEVQDYILLFKNRPFGPLSQQFIGDDSLVSAAWVKRHGVEYSGFSSNSSNLVMSAAYVGGLHSFSNAGQLTATLPSTVGISQGATITLVCSGVGGLVIAAADGDVVFTANGITGSIQLGLGETAEFIRLQAQWRLIGGSVLTRYSALFAAAMSASSANQQLPGLIIKAGNIANASTAATIPLTFPVSFPNVCVALVLSPWQTGGGAYSHSGRDKSGATITRGPNAAFYFDYIAIGY